jgi:hypothetical protein
MLVCMHPFPPQHEPPRRSSFPTVAVVVGGALLLLAVLAVAGAASFVVGRQREMRKEMSSLETELTPGSAGDATQDITDEDYRFRLRWPGQGWRMLRGADAASLDPGAAAGMLHDEGCGGMVDVEAMPGADLAPLAEALMSRIELEDKTMVSKEALRFKGESAMRYVIVGKTSGTELRHDNTIFLHDDYLYQLYAWSYSSQASYECIDTVRSAFTLLEGEVRGRASATKTADEDGVGWRISKGSFESYLHRIAVVPPEGFRVIAGEELHRLDPGATVGLVSQASSLRILMTASRARGVDHRQYADWMVKLAVDAVKGEPAKATSTWKVGDRDVVFQEIHSKDQPPLDQQMAAYFEGDVCFRLQAHYPAATREQALKVLPAGLAAFRPLPADRANKLAAELAAATDPESSFGDDYVLRSGVYSDFKHHLRWRKPRGAWTVAVGERARTENPSARIFFQELDVGVAGMIVVVPSNGASVEESRRDLIAKLTQQEPSAVKVAAQVIPSDLPGMVRGGVDVSDGVNPWRYEVVSAERPDEHVHLVIWALRANLETSRDIVALAAKELTVSAGRIPKTTRSGGGYRDDWFGFAFAPGSEWVMDPTPNLPNKSATVVTWTTANKQRSAVVMAMYLDTQSQEWGLGWVEQNIARRMSETAGRVPERKDATFAGRPARHLAWRGGLSQVDAFIISRNDTFYALILEGPAFADTQTAQLKAAFSLVE